MKKFLLILFLLISSAAAAQQLSEDSLTKLQLLSSSKNELIELAESLDLKSTGSKDDLLNVLFSYYKLENTNLNNNVLFIIKSADKNLSFLIDEINEDYMQLSGNIELTFIDKKNNSTQEISAERVIINNTKKIISASGNVTYTLIKENKRDVYHGDEVIVHIEDWSGYFFEGLSQTIETIDSKEMVFYFSGEKLERNPDGWIILHDGIITSSNPDNPNYRISADKIIMPLPGEWVIQHAVLYIGHIPVFYIPFFYYAKDEMIFHPSIGYTQKEGYNIQTTLYLFGKSQQTDPGGLSFFQINNQEDTNLTGDGFFLRPENEHYSEKSTLPGTDDKIEYMKIMLDNYSNLGFYTGISAHFINLGLSDSLTLYTGLARSRNIYFDPYLGYTPFQENGSGQYVSTWNSSYFFKIKIPLRYGFNISSSYSEGPFSFSFDIPVYSDSYFKNDFSTRSENLAWEKITGINEQTVSSIRSETSSLTWSANLSLTPKMDPDFTLINNFSISALSANLQFDSNMLADIYEEDDVLNFYIPKQFTAPNISMILSGVIFSGTIKQEESSTFEVTEQNNTGKSPWQEDFTAKKESEGETESESELLTGEETDISGSENNDVDQENSLKIAPLFPSTVLQKPSYYTILDHSLSYSINPDFILNGYFDYFSWDHPSLVDFGLLYYKLNTSPSAKIVYKLNLFQDAVSFFTSTDINSNYSARFKDQSTSISDWDAQLQNDKKSSFFSVNNTSTVTVKPFKASDYFQQSTLTYGIGGNIYFTKYDEIGDSFDEYWIDFTEDTIYRNNISANIVFNADLINASLNVNTNLPPANRIINSTFRLNADPFSLEVFYSGAESTGEWINSDFKIKANVNYKDSIIFSQTVPIDLETGELTDLESNLTLKLFSKQLVISDIFKFNLSENMIKSNFTTISYKGLYFSLSASETFPYEFSIDRGWFRSGDETSFEILNFSLQYNKTFPGQYFWKNRIYFDFFINTSLNWDIIQFTNSNFKISLGTNIRIYKFLDLSLSITSYNNSIYRYVPQYTAAIPGVELVNVFDDLLKSFNFFNTADRESSNFNLQSINLKLVHDLDDWFLTIDLSVIPQIETVENVSKYKFIPNFSIYIEWEPIPELQKSIEYKDKNLNF